MRRRSNLTDVPVWFWPILTAVVGVAMGAAGRMTPRVESVATGAFMTTVVTLVALVSPRGALLSLPFALLSITDTIRIRVGPRGIRGTGAGAHPAPAVEPGRRPLVGRRHPKPCGPADPRERAGGFRRGRP